jgi:hypothetical protein
VLMIDQEKDSQQKKQRNNAGTHLYTEWYWEYSPW